MIPRFGHGRLAAAARALPPATGMASIGADLPTTLGLPCGTSFLFTTRTELVECARVTKSGIFSLDRDVRDQAVYRDPEPLRARLATLNEVEAKYGGTFPKSPEYLANKKALEDELALLDARKARSPHAAQDIAFSNVFFNFEAQWNAFYASQIERDSGEAGNATASQLATYDAEYRKFVKQFQALGYKVTHLPPKPGEGNPSAFPWTTILLVGGLVAGAFFLNQLKGVLPTPAPTPARLPRLPAGPGAASAPPPIVHDAEFVEEPPTTRPARTRARYT